MFLNRAAYEFKPYALIIGGGICVLSISHPVAVIAGLVLMGLGGAILKMRKNSRRTRSGLT